MPNFDTSTIEGFDGMTAEQKLEALLKIDLPDMSKYVSKETFDKKASEAANLSKQLKDKMSDDELKEAEKTKALEELQSELESLRKDKTISDYTARYVAMGYDAELAKDTAKAMAEGDMDKVFKNGETHKQALEQKIKQDLMNKTPKPGGNGGGDDGKDSAVEKAKEIAKAKLGGGKQYDDIMKNYRK